MNLFLMIEVISFISSFLVGLVCYKFSRNTVENSFVLFWIGATFMFISFLRFFSTFGLIEIANSRLAIGLFYPFVLITILLNSKKKKIR